MGNDFDKKKPTVRMHYWPEYVETFIVECTYNIHTSMLHYMQGRRGYIYIT